MEEKNKIHIDETKRIQRSIAEQRTLIQEKFNNREMSLVVTKLQEAEHWVAAYREKLADQ